MCKRDTHNRERLLCVIRLAYLVRVLINRTQHVHRGPTDVDSSLHGMDLAIADLDHT